MERSNEFDEAIKNFSKISLEVDTLINSGNADAHKMKNKSIECRSEAIASEASKRLKAFEAEQQGAKSKDSMKTHDTMEHLFMEEVKLEFDRGVQVQKNLLRENSAISESREVENKKSENADDDKESSDSDEETDDENTETTDTSEIDSSEEEDEDESCSDESESEEEEEEVKVDKVVVDSSKK